MLFAEATDKRAFVRDNLAAITQSVIATVSANGEPWAVCVTATYDRQYNVLWQSRTDTRHSENIAANPAVAICSFKKDTDTGDFGFYTSAQAHAVTDPQELNECLRVCFTGKGLTAPDAASLLGDSPLRMYKAVLQQAWVNDQSHKKQQFDLEVQ